MELLRGIFDIVSTLTISDKFGLGAGFLYSDYAWEKANERELAEMKTGVSEVITTFINENRKLLNDDLVQTLHNHLNTVANCNIYTAKAAMNEVLYFLNHKCAYCGSINDIMNNALETIESIPDEDFNTGVKEKALAKIREVKNCSDTDKIPQLIQNLFDYYSENGINVENKAELFQNFKELRKKYLYND
ncbi:MAG: hypothetical protein PUE30_03455 [Spirochaetia bacterium]|nr:hypothetical protein [Spirochaetia bacterium]